MKVLFVVTGIGYGHAIREVSIIRALLEKDPNTKILIAAYKNSYAYFNNKYPVIEINGPEFPDNTFRLSLTDLFASNIFLPVSYIQNLKNLKNVIKEFKPNVIVSDFEPVGISAAKGTNTKFITIFNFDPRLFERFKQEKNPSLNVVLQETYISQVYNASKEGELVIVTLIGPQKKTVKYKFVNPIVRKTPDELPPEKEIMEKLGLKKKPILIMLGGSNFGVTLMNHMLPVLKEFDEDFVIFGYTSQSKLIKNITSFTFKPNFLRYLKVCKGVITLAGHNTLSECLVYKKPMLVFPVIDHIEQQVNAFNVEEYAVVEYLKEPSSEVIRDAIKRFLTERGRLEETLRKLEIQGTGAKEVADIIKKLATPSF